MKVNKIKIPKKICDKFNLHVWFYNARHQALISKKCKRCGINGVELKELKDKS